MKGRVELGRNRVKAHGTCLSLGAQRVLVRMVQAEAAEEYEDAELVCEGAQAWVGLYRTSPAVVLELLQSCLISGAVTGAGVQRYTLNEDGRKAAEDPTYRPPELSGRVRR